ncbi:MAG: hypothetical protein HC918_04450 [Oscillatoriales cyanobacterium SM2_1_8]|nr:hypothetical protein [Oscillatoriales cyanobacterium SM2_1_8]
MDAAPDVLIVGSDRSTNVGGSLVRSDRQTVLVSPEVAVSRWPWLNKVAWRWRKSSPIPTVWPARSRKRAIAIPSAPFW